MPYLLLGRNMCVSEKGKNFQLGDVWPEYYMRVLYLCESNCGLATIRNDNFPQKKILKLELSEGLDDFWEGGHMVFRGTEGELGDKSSLKENKGGTMEN